MNDLCVITSYYNPSGYQTKFTNYNHFKNGILESGVPLITVECTFGNSPYVLTEDPEKNVQVIKVCAADILWQKERLLNIALEHLPQSCTKVVWVDADILFDNRNWAYETSALLEKKAVAQLFTQVVRLPRDVTRYNGDGEMWDSFAHIMRTDPQTIESGDFAKHGHTGFAWAIRREIIQRHGFYDACVSGSGDHMMAHAFAGDWHSSCIERIVGSNTPHRKHFIDWAQRIYPDIRARIGVVDGLLAHLWHGDHINRRYVLRNKELEDFSFDPSKDITIDQNGCWKWSPSRSDLKQWAIEYYNTRKEDG